MMNRTSHVLATPIVALLVIGTWSIPGGALAKTRGTKPPSSARGSDRHRAQTEDTDLELELDSDIDLDLEDAPDASDLEASREEPGPIKVSFAVLKKRSWAYVGSQVCFQGAILSIHEELEASYIQVIIRTAGRLDATHQVMLEHLAATPFLPNDEVRFCGTVMGVAQVPAQANWRIEAIEILADQVSKARSPGSKISSRKTPVPPAPAASTCQDPENKEVPAKKPAR